MIGAALIVLFEGCISALLGSILGALLDWVGVATWWRASLWVVALWISLRFLQDARDRIRDYGNLQVEAGVTATDFGPPLLPVS